MEPIGKLRCANGHVVGAEVLPGIHVVQADHRVIVGRMLRISCRGCPEMWESPEVAMVARLLDQVPGSDTAVAMRQLLGLDEVVVVKAA